MFCYIWWLVRVTCVVAFGFLPQNFGRWWGPTSDTFCSHINAVGVVWTIKGGVDTQTLLAVKIFFELFALSGSRGTKTLAASSHARAWALEPNEQPGGISVTYFFLLYKS